MGSFKIFFATPDRKIVSDMDLEQVTVPGEAGELNILQGHAPLMTNLEPGILRYTLKNGERKSLAISWGYCQISTDGVTILAETATASEDLNAQVVQSKLKETEQVLGQQQLNEEEWTKTQQEASRLRAEISLISEKAH